MIFLFRHRFLRRPASNSVDILSPVEESVKACQAQAPFQLVIDCFVATAAPRNDISAIATGPASDTPHPALSLKGRGEFNDRLTTGSPTRLRRETRGCRGRW